MNVAFRINPSDYSVALSLADAAPVYFRQESAQEVEIINPTTGEVSTLPVASFRVRYVPGAHCPPHLQEKAMAVPEYREWKRERERVSL